MVRPGITRRRTPSNLFKVTLLALLCANTAYFAIGGSISKALDAAAWLTLLLLFEAETQFATQLRSKRQRAIVRTVRLAAAAGVVAATIGYMLEDDVLDAVNSALWIAVVVLLEIQVRCRDRVGARSRRVCRGRNVPLRRSGAAGRDLGQQRSVVRRLRRTAVAGCIRCARTRSDDRQNISRRTAYLPLNE